MRPQNGMTLAIAIVRRVVRHRARSDGNVLAMSEDAYLIIGAFVTALLIMVAVWALLGA